MSGDATIDLAKRVHKARALVNETLAHYGPNSHAYYRAKLALTAVQREAKGFMS